VLLGRGTMSFHPDPPTEKGQVKIFTGTETLESAFESAFVRLTPHSRLPSVAVDENLFAEVVRAAFTQRRKTLRNALRDHASGDELSGLGIDPGLRPERLSVAEFVQIANAVTARSIHGGIGASGPGVLPANHARGR